MNASTFTFQRDQAGSSETRTDVFDGRFLSSRIGVSLSEQHCPSCNSIVYSRRHGTCGVCEQKLPENFLFDSVETERIDALLTAERQRHKTWLMKCGAELRP